MEYDLADLLAFYPAPFQPLRVQSLGGAGGFSGAQFWRISTTEGEFVVRRWPPEHPSHERLALIHAVLQFAGERGVQILPIPVQGREGNSAKSGIFTRFQDFRPPRFRIFGDTSLCFQSTFWGAGSLPFGNHLKFAKDRGVYLSSFVQSKSGPKNVGRNF